MKLKLTWLTFTFNFELRKRISPLKASIGSSEVRRAGRCCDTRTRSTPPYFGKSAWTAACAQLRRPSNAGNRQSSIISNFAMWVKFEITITLIKKVCVITCCGHRGASGLTHAVRVLTSSIIPRSSTGRCPSAQYSVSQSSHSCSIDLIFGGTFEKMRFVVFVFYLYFCRTTSFLMSLFFSLILFAPLSPAAETVFLGKLSD